MVQNIAQTVALIGCSKQKRPEATLARDLYQGPLFRKSLAYAESVGADAIYVLSAKHGLTPIDQQLEPYDVTLHSMSASEVRAWAKAVLDQLDAVADLHHDTFVLLAGEAYRRYLVSHLTNAEVPLRGLGIGEQLRFLNQALERRT